MYTQLHTQHTQQLRALLAQAKKAERPLGFAVTGSGLNAATIVKGGVSFLMVLNAGVYRVAGCPSQIAFMPCGNANTQVEKLIRHQILPRCPGVPLVAGLLPNDPQCSLDTRFEILKTLGVAGVINWPPASINSGRFWDALRQRGFSEEEERKALERAKEHGFVTFGFASTVPAAIELSKADVDAMVVNLGWTLYETETLDKEDRTQYAIQHTNALIASIQERVSREPVYFFYGGSISSPQDMYKIYQKTKVDGYGAGSALELYPIRDYLQSITQQFLHGGPERAGITYDRVDYPNFIGTSPPVAAMYTNIKRTAAYPVSVCVEGSPVWARNSWPRCSTT